MARVRLSIFILALAALIGCGFWLWTPDKSRTVLEAKYLNAPGDIIEIPVTTMPLLKFPIHASYILYLSCYSTALAMTYFRTALSLCRITGTPPSILLHPLDFLGGDDGRLHRLQPLRKPTPRTRLQAGSWAET